MQWNEKKRTEMNKHCNVWKIKSAAVDGAFRSSVVMPVISDQDTGKSHTFDKPPNKVSNHLKSHLIKWALMKWNESLKGWVVNGAPSAYALGQRKDTW